MLVQLKTSLSLMEQEGAETWRQWPAPQLASPAAPVTQPCSPQLQNNSLLPIKFSMQLDSLSSRSRDKHRLPQFLASPDQRTEVVGKLASWGDHVGHGGGMARGCWALQGDPDQPGRLAPRHPELQWPECVQRGPSQGRHGAWQGSGLHCDLQPRPREPVLL